MTGLEGNRQIYLPREIQDQVQKRFQRNFWEGHPESQGTNSLLPEGPVIICFIIPLCLEDTQRNRKIYHGLDLSCLNDH